MKLTTKAIYCSNCGHQAQKSYVDSENTKVIETTCPHCDYFMAQYADTGSVIEAYAPGLVPLSAVIKF